jgi:hypothetical protein
MFPLRHPCSRRSCESATGAHSSNRTPPPLQSLLCRDAVTKTSTVADLIQSLDAQGVTSHLTFLLSVFFAPAIPSAPANSFDKKNGKKREGAEAQEHLAAVSSTAQVTMTTAIMIIAILAFEVTLPSSKSGPSTVYVLS